jgi:hypothetical protein
MDTNENQTKNKYRYSEAYLRAQATYREKNREKGKARSRAYYLANKEKIAEKAKLIYKEKTKGNIRKKRTTKKKVEPEPDESKFTLPDITADDLLIRND